MQEQFRYNRIKIALFEAGFTNKWLADKLGMSYSIVSRWCRNEKQPSIEMLFKIAEVLNTDVCSLLNTPKKS